MALFAQFEQDQRILKEIKSLFEVVSPAELCRSINDLVFAQLTSENAELPSQKELLARIYLLLNFLEEMRHVNVTGN